MREEKRGGREGMGEREREQGREWGGWVSVLVR